MAEVRKFAPGKGGHIAEAIAKAMGESVRPVTPGGSADPSKKDAPKSKPRSVTATSFLVSDQFLVPHSPTPQPEEVERSDPRTEAF